MYTYIIYRRQKHHKFALSSSYNGKKPDSFAFSSGLSFHIPMLFFFLPVLKSHECFSLLFVRKTEKKTQPKSHFPRTNNQFHFNFQAETSFGHNYLIIKSTYKLHLNLYRKKSILINFKIQTNGENSVLLDFISFLYDWC